MIISYHGVEFFKVQFGDITLAYNPVSKDSKFKPTRFGADIALISLNNKDFNGEESVSRTEKQPFVVSGPGEYEVKKVFIKGFMSNSAYGGEEKINTIYSVVLEGMNLCFLGALNESQIKSETRQALDEIDLLFVPIGGDGVLDAESAYKFAVNLEPKIIIPMHYGDVGDKDALKTFLKEGGYEKTEVLDKLTIKKKDLEGKNAEIVVLSANV